MPTYPVQQPGYPYPQGQPTGYSQYGYPPQQQPPNY